MDPKDLKAGAYNFAQVFEDEATELKEQCGRRGAEADLNFDQGEPPVIPDRFGLAFSGGGIRSASVQLGVVQALAKSRMLRQAHYISAISGGGYLLGWLTAWIRRQPCDTNAGSFDQVEDQLAANSATGKEEDVAGSPGFRRQLEPFTIHFLRRYTSFLTPRKGIFSGDLLSAVSIYLRNVLLNLLLVGTLAISAMLVLQFPAFLNTAHHKSGIFLNAPIVFWLVVMVFFAASGTAMWKCSKSLYLVTDGETEPEKAAAAWIVIFSATAACVALWLMLPVWYTDFRDQRIWPGWFVRHGGSWIAHHSMDMVTAIAVLVLMVFGLATSLPYYRHQRAKRKTQDSAKATKHPAKDKAVHSVARGGWLKWLTYFAAWAVAAGVAWLAHIVVHGWLVRDGAVQMSQTYAVLGLPAFLLGLSLISFLWVGIMGIALPDAQREWLARAAGYFLAFAAVIGLVFAIAYYGPVGMHLLFTPFRNPTWKKAIVAIILPGGWLFTVITGLVGGKSPRTDGKKSSGFLDYAVSDAPAVFLLGLLLMTSWASHALVSGLIHGPAGAQTRQYLPWGDWHIPTDVKAAKYVDWAPRMSQPPVAAPQDSDSELVTWFNGLGPVKRYSLLILLFAGIGGILCFRLNVNEFSQHLFYRNRLVRAFLGASHPETAPGEEPPKANKFTGFAYDDDIFLRELVATEGFDGPYPIWGTCLNLTTGEDLAWQKRKGASFIYSPLFCGWDYVRGLRPQSTLETAACEEDGALAAGKLHKYAYRSTRPNSKDCKIRGYIPGYGGDGGAALIGTAMAASGAAISPNWGYHSSPAVAALLTLFNVRLGWWTGNPRHVDRWKEYAPSILYLLSELTGNATDAGKYVYLSDGGHFENLGIYELVRRRVRFIICSDADADPDFEFQDLGNAVSACRRDFGVEIKLGAQSCITLSKDPYREAHFAAGEIIYPGQPQRGLLLYVKSSLTSDEPADVLAMRSDHPDFPHDTTLNQFFDEQIFESYRALGEHIMMYLIEKSGAMGFNSGPTVAGARVRAFYNWVRPQAPQ